MLAPTDVKSYYDWFGSRQDAQAFYEDPALDDLLAHADLSAAAHVVELGCGTGRLAHRMLGVAARAEYRGFDISTTMVDLARRRLAPLGSRVAVAALAPGIVTLPLPPGFADRLVSTYVLDLLPESTISAFLDEAKRLLSPDGLLCLVGITPGVTFLSRLLMGAWQAVWRVHPRLVGGCRPLPLRHLVEGAAWRVTHARTVVSWGVASEVVVATLPG